jgi:hypothetical protein
MAKTVQRMVGHPLTLYLIGDNIYELYAMLDEPVRIIRPAICRQPEVRDTQKTSQLNN